MKHDYDRYLDENATFNAKISRLTDDVFQMDRVNKAGYFQSCKEDKIDFRSIQEYTYPHKSNKESVFQNLDELGPAENKLYSAIEGPGDLIIYAGAMGSGKTATLSHVVAKYVENHSCTKCNSNCIPQQVWKIWINCNTIICADDLELGYQEVMDRLREALRGNLKRIFESIDIFKFKDAVLNYPLSSWGISFHSFVTRLSIEDPKEVVVQKLFHEIEKQKDNTLKDIFLYANLIFYLIDFEKVNPRCFLVIVDNFDELQDELQDKFLERFVRIMETARCKLIIAVRLTAIKKITQDATFSYRLLEHKGILPATLIQHRIEHFRSNPNRYQGSGLRPLEKDMFEKRIQQLMDFFDKKSKSKFQDKFLVLGGISIRRSLNIVQKIFINNYLTWNEEKLTINKFMIAMSTAMVEKNSWLSNIFSIETDFSTHQFSYQPVRILQFLSEWHDQEITVTLSRLYYELTFYDKDLTYEIFCAAINKLIWSKCRFAYVEGRGKFANAEDIKKEKGRHIHITVSGYKFINGLADVHQYVDQCLLLADWSHVQPRTLTIKKKGVEFEFAPYGPLEFRQLLPARNMKEFFVFLTYAAKYLLSESLNDYYISIKLNTYFHRTPLIGEFIINVTGGYFAITKDYWPEVQEQLEDWLSLCYFSEQLLVNSKLNLYDKKIIKEVEKFIDY